MQVVLYRLFVKCAVRYYIAYQAFRALLVGFGQYYCLAYFFAFVQDAFYLAKLYPVASYLYLVVYSALVFYRPVFQPSAQIACFVQSCVWFFAERIADESFFG